MSTSDAVRPELSAPTAKHGAALSAATREQQDDSFNRFEKNPSGRQDFPSALGQEEGPTSETHSSALIIPDKSVKTNEETLQHNFRIQQPFKTTFPSCLFLRTSQNPELRANQNPHLNTNQNAGLSLCRLTFKSVDDHSCFQTDGLTSGEEQPLKVFTDPTSSDDGRFTDRTGVSLPVTSYELETVRDCTKDLTLLSGDSGGLKSTPCVKDLTQSEKKADPVEPSNPHRTMLSSSVVMVLAPHWSGKLRRNKRFEGTSNPEAQGTSQDVTNSVSNREHVQLQETADQSSIHRSHEPLRTSFVGTRRNTEGWSTKSGPASLDYGSKRRVMHTVSLDVNSGRLDNRKVDTLSSIATTSPPSPPVSLDQRLNPQTLKQDGLLPLSSKPTTSSLLLSLRRFNSNSRISTAGAPLSEMNLAVPSRLSQTHQDNKNQDMSNPLHYPSPISCKPHSSPLLSPLSTNHRGKTVSETHFFSASSLDKDIQDFRQPKKITRAQSSLLSSNQPVRNRCLSERHQNFRGSDTNLFSESSDGRSPSRSNYCSAFLLPQKTTLTSTSLWKQVYQEGSPPKLNNTISLKGKLNTPLAPPSNNNKSDLAPDIKGFNSQIANNRDHNSTTESVCTGSLNPVVKPQGGSYNLKERTTEDSDKLDKQQSESRFNNNEPQKHQSLPDVFSRSKISRATAQTLSHSEDLREFDGSDKSLTPNMAGLRPTLQTQHKNNQCESKTNSSTTSPHSKDSQSLPPPHLSVTSQTASSLSPPSSKTDAPFNSHPFMLSHTGSSPQMSRFTVGVTPLGFERSYDSATESFQPKASRLPTVKVFSKTHSAPVSAAPFTTAKHQAATDALGTSLLTLPDIPALSSSSTPTCSSSFLTPPVTPILTSPDSASSSPQEGRDFSSSQERDSKKDCSEVKRVRRVTWEDSVDLQQSEPITVHTKEPSQVPTSPLSYPGSSLSVRAPSIFTFLRSSNPTTNTYPLGSQNTRASSIQAGERGKYRSFSSDSADSTSTGQDRLKLRPNDPLILDQKAQAAHPTSQERTQSEPAMVQSCSSAAVSLPPDFLSGYRLRYSSPPYSTLMSARSTQGEAKPITPRSQLFQHLSKNADPGSTKTSLKSKAHPTPISPRQPLAPPSHSKASTQESSYLRVTETCHVNNKTISQDSQNSEMLLVNNKERISSHSQQEAEGQGSAPTCVIETLVYSVTPKGETVASKINISKTLHNTANTAVTLERRFSQPSQKVLNKGTAEEPGSHSGQSSSGNSSTDSAEDDCRKMKDSALSKSRFFSVESNNEQSPKKSRFTLRKNNSTPNSSLARSESDRASKTNNKMDQVLSRLRQTFSTRRSDDELSFPWRWRRASQTPSSDISNVSEVPAEIKTLVKPEQEKEELLRDNIKDTEENNKWTPDSYSLTSIQTSGGSDAAEKLLVWSDKPFPEHHNVPQSLCAEQMSEIKIKTPLTIQSPTTHPFNFYNNVADYQPANQLFSLQDLSPERSANLSAGYPSQFMRATPSPRSPFSPFSSLSPLSPFPSPDVTDDNVFYSPKLQRRRESPSPCDEKPGEDLSLKGSWKSRTSTGPPVPGGQDKTSPALSCADLKYGIEPGRSFSVSSVLSSRPSGPGRISTGSRFMSVGDLSESALTCGGTRKGPNQCSVSPDWNAEYDSLPSKDSLTSYFSGDPCKMRTRSLPRSLTRCLANWSSGVSVSEGSVSKPARPWSPNMNTSHFAWDTEGPPTPPPTPPLSPVSRRMSKPSSLSSPTCPSTSGPQQMDSTSPRGHLPSRGYISSLRTFEESSDNSSDTTTDDEYYLETGEDDKETEL